MLLLLSLLPCILSTSIHITPSTSRSELSSYFICTSLIPIGSYNEYSQVCTFQSKATLVFTNVTIEARRDLPCHASVIEMIVISPNITLENSTLLASSITLVSDVVRNSHSTLNVTNRGLIYGPGYSRYGGSSYAGQGGFFHKRLSRDNVNSIGSITCLWEEMEDFRGFGSGGGAEMHRGGGKINITSTSIQWEGTGEANGGHAGEESCRGAAGGTIVLVSTHLFGNGTFTARGGNAQILHDKYESGAGGGGRIVLHVEKNELELTKVDVFGGNANVTYAAGAAGTLLLWNTREGTLIVRGRHDISGTIPIQVPYASTIVLFDTEERKLPVWLTTITLQNGAVVIASQLNMAKKGLSGWSQFSIDASSTLFTTPRYGTTLLISAGYISLLGRIGFDSTVPSDRELEVSNAINVELDATHFELRGGAIFADTVSISSAQDTEWDAASSVSITSSLVIQSLQSIHFYGFIQSSSVSASAYLKALENINLAVQPVQTPTISATIFAGNCTNITISDPTAFTSLTVSSRVLYIQGSAPSTLPSLCLSQDTSNTACTDHAPEVRPDSTYPLRLFASDAIFAHNVYSPAILCCANTVSVTGDLSAAGLGCLLGPGNGTAGGTIASGGAGHGGHGGRVMINGHGQENTAGPSYDSFNEPSLPGSGSCSQNGKMTGGRGGGIIYISARNITLAPDASISVAGTNGVRRGGGGSGGTLILLASESLRGNGTLDASGGNSTSTEVANERRVWDPVLSERRNILDAIPVGGGGAGGRIRVVWGKVTIGPAFLDDGGRLNIQGGFSTGQKGEVGQAAPTHCSSGTGHVFCTDCEPGEYSPNATSACLPCSPGSFSNTSAAPTCSRCMAGKFSAEWGQSTCANCTAGHIAPQEGSSHCTNCPTGSYINTDAATRCLLCPKGTIAVNASTILCTPCPLGYTTNGLGKTSCMACLWKPYYATYTVGDCTYICDKGRVGPSCWTPFERLVRNIGGPVGFVILCIAAMAAIFALWGKTAHRRLPRPSLTQDTEPSLIPVSHYEKWIQDVDNETKVRQSKETPRLHASDLKRHWIRIYFHGQNTSVSPWYLSNAPPVALESHVYSGSYELFVKQCTEIMAWKTFTKPLPFSCENFLLHVLSYVCPPLHHVYLSFAQMARIRTLSAFVSETQGRFFRNLDWQMGTVVIKLGVSPCSTVGYLDILRPESQEYLKVEDELSSLHDSFPQWHAILHATHQLIDVVVSGTGTFLSPLYFDTNDIYLRSIPSQANSLADTAWVEFVAEFNIRIRAVVPYEDPTTVQALYEWVTEFNTRGTLSGLIVHFGLWNENGFQYWTTSSSTMCSLHRFAVRIDRNVASSSLTSRPSTSPVVASPQVSNLSMTGPSEKKTSDWRQSKILHRFAVRIDRNVASSNLTARTSTSPVVASPQVCNLSMTGPSEEKTSDWRQSKIRQHELYGEEENDNIDRKVSVDSSIDTTPLIYPVSPPSTMSWIKSSTVLQCIVSYITLRHVDHHPNTHYYRTRPVHLLCILIVDMLLTFLFFTEVACLQTSDPRHVSCSPFVLIVVNAYIPCAVWVAPLYGLFFLLHHSGKAGRMYALWNLCSMMNLLVGVCCSIYYFNFLGILAVVYPLVLLGLKHVEINMTLACILHFEQARPLSGWRGLYTTTEYYDATTNPAVVHA